MRKIRVAQIGTSIFSHGTAIFQTMAHRSDLFEIVGYAFPENEREMLNDVTPEIFKGYPELTVEQILNDPTIEAVTVETEEKYLCKYALMAAKAGKHIHMEKPGGTDPAEFALMMDEMRKSGKVFHTGYMYRYNKTIRSVIERARSGEIGQVISVEAEMNCLHGDKLRRWLGGYPGGMTFFLGCHLIDLIVNIKGKPDKIYPFNRTSGINGIDTIDQGAVILEYSDGISIAKTNCIQRGGFSRRKLVVTGTLGTLEVWPLEGDIGKPAYEDQYTALTEFTSTVWGDKGVRSESEYYHRYDAMMSGFASFIRGEAKNPYDYDYEQQLYEILMQAVK